MNSGGPRPTTAKPRAPAAEPWTGFSELTPRERGVLELLARGLDNGAIAERLFLAKKTVRNYVSTIYDKLQVPSRARAIVLAREAGYGRDPDRARSETGVPR